MASIHNFVARNISQKGLELVQQIRKVTKYKSAPKLNAFISVNLIWCSLKNDYRTLVGLEDVSVVESYIGAEEEKSNG